MAAPSLIVGPLLRYVDSTRATVWVETDRPCLVQILHSAAQTWMVHDHHYALVVIEGLEPGTEIPYTVSLDGTRVWPDPESEFPPSVMRTFRDDETFQLAFGSCRRAEPFDDAALEKFGADALVALAERMRTQPTDQWPDAIFLGGDQVYADTPSTAMLQRVRAAHAGRPTEWDEVTDEIGNFEEYTWLYAESWTPEPIRWLLSTVPTCMLLDDHDLRDDWNTSQAWRDWITQRPWWPDRVKGAFASYWIYQHLGNLSPSELAADEAWAMVRSDVTDDERSAALDAFAWRSDTDPASARWSFFRDFGSDKLAIRLLAIDSRCSRRLDPDDRGIVDHVESAWLQEKATVPGIAHLIVASPLPVLVAHGIHHLEGWNEAVASGAYGPKRGIRFGEWVRREVDLEHWAAFRKSFDLVVALLRRIVAHPDAPASVLILSGDVHCSYTARAELPGSTAIYQLTMSPFRNPLERSIQFANRALKTRPVRGFMHLLARTARVRDVDIDWVVDNGPWFDNGVMTVSIRGRKAWVDVEHAVVDGSRQVLRHTATISLTDRSASQKRPRGRLLRRRR